MRKPAHMSLEEWQTALRREFGREQTFDLRNIGSEPVFSEYTVTNPDTGRAYLSGRAQTSGTNLYKPTGLDFIGKLGQAMQAPAEGTETSAPSMVPRNLIARNDETGETYLKLPLPGPDTIKKIVDIVTGLANAFQNQMPRNT